MNKPKIKILNIKYFPDNSVICQTTFQGLTCYEVTFHIHKWSCAYTEIQNKYEQKIPHYNNTSYTKM